MTYYCPAHAFECHSHKAFVAHVSAMRCPMFARLVKMIVGRS